MERYWVYERYNMAEVAECQLVAWKRITERCIAIDGDIPSIDEISSGSIVEVYRHTIKGVAYQRLDIDRLKFGIYQVYGNILNISFVDTKEQFEIVIHYPSYHLFFHEIDREVQYLITIQITERYQKEQ